MNFNFKYSLEDFLTLPDEHDYKNFDKRLNGKEWLWLYNIAKNSYEKYGENGPAINSQVMPLFAGHGGGAGVIREFLGIYWADENYFAISRKENGGERISLVFRKYWWREILPIEFLTKEIPCQRTMRLRVFYL